jgi:hypothetical protein
MTAADGIVLRNGRRACRRGFAPGPAGSVSGLFSNDKEFSAKKREKHAERKGGMGITVISGRQEGPDFYSRHESCSIQV